MHTISDVGWTASRQRRNRHSEGNACRFPKQPQPQNSKEMEERILQEIEGLKSLMVLAAKSTLTLDDVCLLYGLSKSTVYKMTSGRTIPHYRKGKLLFFDKTELDQWAKANRVNTQQESEQAAIAYVMKVNN